LLFCTIEISLSEALGFCLNDAERILGERLDIRLDIRIGMLMRALFNHAARGRNLSLDEFSFLLFLFPDFLRDFLIWPWGQIVPSEAGLKKLLLGDLPLLCSDFADFSFLDLRAIYYIYEWCTPFIFYSYFIRILFVFYSSTKIKILTRLISILVTILS
jgi:hypothetical protein